MGVAAGRASQTSMASHFRSTEARRRRAHSRAQEDEENACEGGDKKTPKPVERSSSVEMQSSSDRNGCAMLADAPQKDGTLTLSWQHRLALSRCGNDGTPRARVGCSGSASTATVRIVG